MGTKESAEATPTADEVAAFVEWFHGSDEKPLPERRTWLATCIKVTCKAQGLSTLEVGKALGRGDYYFYQMKKGYGQIDGVMARKLVQFLGVGEWWLTKVRETYEKRYKYRRS